MSRISIPSTADAAPIASQPLLSAVKAMLGSVPNLFRLVANSPAALEGYLGLNGALAKGALDARTREQRTTVGLQLFDGEKILRGVASLRDDEVDNGGDNQPEAHQELRAVRGRAGEGRRSGRHSTIPFT